MVLKQVSYPSDELPGQPSVEFELPDSWSARTAPGVAFAALDSSSPGGFATNLVVTIRRIAAGPTLEAVAAEVGEEIETLAEFASLSDGVAEIGGRPVSVREYGFLDEKHGVTVFQLQLIVLVPADASTTDVVTATLSHGADGLEDDIDLLRSVARSMSIER